MSITFQPSSPWVRIQGFSRYIRYVRNKRSGEGRWNSGLGDWLLICGQTFPYLCNRKAALGRERDGFVRRNLGNDAAERVFKRQRAASRNNSYRPDPRPDSFFVRLSASPGWGVSGRHPGSEVGATLRSRLSNDNLEIHQRQSAQICKYEADWNRFESSTSQITANCCWLVEESNLWLAKAF